MDKITWGDILDLSGDDPFRRVLDSINELIQVSNKMVASLHANNQKIATDLNGIQTEAKELSGTLSKMSVETKEAGTALSGAAKRSAELSGSMVALNKVEAENVATIEMLTKKIEKLEATQKKATKATIEDANSVNDLRKKLTEADEAYRALGDSSSEAIKQDHLNKVKELAKQFNTANKALNEAKKGTNAVKGSYDELSQRVSNLKKELKGLDDGFDKNSAKAASLRKQIKEGSDKLKEFDKSIGDTQRSVGDYGIAIGELDSRTGGLVTNLGQVKNALAAAFSSPYVLAATALVGAFIALKAAANAYYESSIEGEEELQRLKLREEFVEQAVRNAFKESGKEIGGFFAWFQEQSEDFQLQMARMFGSASQLTKKQFEDLKATVDASVDSMTEKQKKYFRDHIRDVVDDADTELKVNALLEVSKNKLLFSDEERLAAIKEVKRLQEEQLKGDVQLAQDAVDIQKEYIKGLGGRLIDEKLLKDYSDDEVTAIGVKGQHIEKLAQLEAALMKVQSDASLKSIAANKVLNSAYAEIEKDKHERMKREREARENLNKLIIQDEIDTNEDILRSNKSTAEEKIIALDELNKERAALREIDKQHEINAAIEASEERARAEGKNVAEEVANDQALLGQKLAIERKYNQLSEDDAQKTGEAIAKVTYEAYVVQQGDTLGLSADQQILYWKDRLEVAKAAGQDLVAIEKTIAALEFQVSEEGKKLRIRQEEEYQKTLVQLRDQSIASSLEILKNGFQREAEMLEARKSRLETMQAQELELAGDNADAKARIENDYAVRLQEIENEQREVKRRQAIADKAFAAFQIVLNTSIAVTKALAELGPFGVPASLALGAIGALQLAAVLSRPIPQFAEGTDSSPEGLAIVAEKGPELAVSRSGKATLYDTPGATLTYLERGTKVYDAEDTERIMSGREFDNVTSSLTEGQKKVGRAPIDGLTAKAVAKLGSKMDDMTYEVRNFKALEVNITRKGVETMARRGEWITKFLDKFYP